jgi:hypothetical protein
MVQVEGELQTVLTDFVGVPTGSSVGALAGIEAQADKIVLIRKMRVFFDITITYRLSTPFNYIILTYVERETK